MYKNKIEIIAEMGQGFSGSFNLAMMLSKSASNTCADSVKFQMVFADELAVKNYKYYSLFKSLELKFSEWKKIVTFLKKNKKKTYFDIFGVKSLKFAENLKVNGVKIHPTDILNFDLLQKVKNSKIKKIFLGIGGLNPKSIDSVVKFFFKKKIVLLSGFQGYPTSVNSNNINNICYLKKKYYKNKFIDYGFADHESSSFSNTLMLSALAIGAGANYIEKHFTLTETLKMEDYESALSPERFNEYSRKLKKIYNAKNSLNIDQYKISISEKKYHQKVIRQVIAKRNILKNKVVKINDLTLKRSNDESALNNIHQCLGKKTKILISKGSPIKISYIK
jgi:sialic acid synthase SpsE